VVGITRGYYCLSNPYKALQICPAALEGLISADDIPQLKKRHATVIYINYYIINENINLNLLSNFILDSNNLIKIYACNLFNSKFPVCVGLI
jgi:hypothetical protein